MRRNKLAVLLTKRPEVIRVTNNELIAMEIDGVRFQLRARHDFAWLNDIGQVFRVFDRQDSGNICFGVQSGEKSLFLKYAGARTVRHDGEPSEAVERLCQAISVYEALEHPYLVTLLDHRAIDDGYLAVFDWFDGEVLHSPEFPRPAKYEDPRSPYRRFLDLPVERRLECLDRIFQFHEFAEEQGYITVDFYDGSILYNFESHEVRICDIDHYEPAPFTNNMGRMWGSSRFRSPEEFELGAPIDGITNVFNMGATAFCFVGGTKDRSRQLWEASEELYRVALKAVNPERDMRYSSVSEFRAAWEKARDSS